MKMRPNRKALLTLLSFFAVAIFVSTSIQAQVPGGARAGKGFISPYYEGNTLKAAFIGESADNLPNGLILVTKFQIKTFRNSDENQIDQVISTPKCIFNPTTKRAYSSERLQMFTGNTNYLIEGEGFIWEQTKTNIHLIISNKVHTIIQRDSTNSLVASTNLPTEIFSDHFEFFAQTNSDQRIAIYTGNVHVTDEQMELTSERLKANLPSQSNTVKDILAEGNVVITSKRDQSRATGQQAIYRSDKAGEFIELIGDPTWRDSRYSGNADKFIFDRTNKIVRAEGHAHMLLPRDATNQISLGFITTTNATAKTNSPIAIFAETLTAKLPETNGPIHQITAENNVLIMSASDKLHATAGRADFSETTGLLEMTKSPVVQIDGNEMRGDLISIGLTNKTVSAQRNAYVKLLTKNPGSSGTNNSPVEFYADRFDYQTNQARLTKDVRANFARTQDAKGELTCQWLTVDFGTSNQVVNVLAEGGVNFHEELTQGNTNFIKNMTSGMLAVKRSPETGFLQTLIARTNIFAEQIETVEDRSKIEKIRAQLLDVQFSATTNQIEQLTAEQNVFIEKTDRQGKAGKPVYVEGQRIVYKTAGGKEIAELTGNPTANDGDYIFSEATALLWDVKTGKISSRGGYKATPIVQQLVLPETPKP